MFSILWRVDLNVGGKNAWETIFGMSIYAALMCVPLLSFSALKCGGKLTPFSLDHLSFQPIGNYQAKNVCGMLPFVCSHASKYILACCVYQD